jgi:hypothetical protein
MAYRHLNKTEARLCWRMGMKKLYVSIFAICSAAIAAADVPVYRDQTLSIGEALVVTEGKASYYADIKLAANPDGSFELVQAQRLEHAHVESVAVEVGGPDRVAVNVEVSGYLPDPCHQLEEPAVMREGSTFTILVPQRPLQTFAACVLMIEPFTVSVALSVEGLQAGHYTVMVNDKQSGFDLP